MALIARNPPQGEIGFTQLWAEIWDYSSHAWQFYLARQVNVAKNATLRAKPLEKILLLNLHLQGVPVRKRATKIFETV
ncbi:MAG: hypothetical protein ACOY3L_14340 [Pseudomonadota bacterium]